MIALQAFLVRQRFNITDMEAFGQIRSGKIKVEGGGITGNTAAGGPILPGAKLVKGFTGAADNTNNVEVSVQISENDIGYKTKQQVNPSVVRLLSNIGLKE